MILVLLGLARRGLWSAAGHEATDREPAGADRPRRGRRRAGRVGRASALAGLDLGESARRGADDAVRPRGHRARVTSRAAWSTTSSTDNGCASSRKPSGATRNAIASGRRRARPRERRHDRVDAPVAGGRAAPRRHDVTVRFGGVVALDQVSLAVPVGSTVGLVGPNGAGKTTLFGVLSGLLRPKAGRVTMNGVDVTGRSPQTRARRGLVAHVPADGAVHRAHRARAPRRRPSGEGRTRATPRHGSATSAASANARARVRTKPSTRSSPCSGSKRSPTGRRWRCRSAPGGCSRSRARWPRNPP